MASFGPVEVGDFRVAKKKIFLKKKFGHVKNIEGKAPVVSKRPETSLGFYAAAAAAAAAVHFWKTET